MFSLQNSHCVQIGETYELEDTVRAGPEQIHQCGPNPATYPESPPATFALNIHCTQINTLLTYTAPRWIQPATIENRLTIGSGALHLVIQPKDLMDPISLGKSTGLSIPTVQTLSHNPILQHHSYESGWIDSNLVFVGRCSCCLPDASTYKYNSTSSTPASLMLRPPTPQLPSTCPGSSSNMILIWAQSKIWEFTMSTVFHFSVLF